MSKPPLRLLSAGSVEPGLVRAVEAFSLRAGVEVQIDWATTPNIRRRLSAGEKFDLVVLTADAARDLTAGGRLRSEPHAAIGSVGVGVAVRAGASVPAIDSAELLKRALNDADAVIFTLATSGIAVEAMLRRKDVYGPLLSKILRFETGPQMMEYLIHSTGNVVCLGAAVELRMFDGQGVRYLGPLPESLQHRTAYVAARSTDTVCADAAGALAAYLAHEEGRRYLADCGVDVSSV